MTSISGLKRFVIFLVLIACSVIVSCEDDFSVRSIEDTFKYDHQLVITEDEVWLSDHPHRINDDIYIQDAIVTIEPGTVIQIDENASINIMSRGVLIADGDEKRKITFTRQPDAGNWECVFFSANSGSNECLLDYCVLEYGGSDPAYPAIIYCEEVGPTITNSEIRYSEAYGIYLEGACSPMIFERNVFSSNDKAPIITAITNAGIIGSGDFIDNGDDYIEINSGNLLTDVQMIDRGLPYLFTEDVVISGVKLTIAEGCSLLFLAGKGLSVVEHGSLSANSSNRDIWFTGYDNTNENWRGIYIDSGTPSVLNNCYIEYGGDWADHPANLTIAAGQHMVNNCVIRRSLRYGVHLGSDCLVTFSNNFLEENAIAPLSMPVNSMTRISDNEFSRSNRHIELRGGAREGLLTGDVMLYDCGIPYYVTDDIQIKNGTLQIGSGVNLSMANGTSIDVLEGGGLTANGSTHIITIDCQSPFSGSWHGIYFSPYIRQGECYLNLCRIMYGGGDDERPANIFCDTSSPHITNCIIEQSLGYGIYLAGDANPILINNTFFSNLLGPINR
ncbi:hypothetical protein JXB12_09965 [candidate division KSB1 bacterium]|nr:hypothetical protein [candidate division KSB1 bacterium]